MPRGRRGRPAETHRATLGFDDIGCEHVVTVVVDGAGDDEPNPPAAPVQVFSPSDAARRWPSMWALGSRCDRSSLRSAVPEGSYDASLPWFATSRACGWMHNHRSKCRLRLEWFRVIRAVWMCRPAQTQRCCRPRGCWRRYERQRDGSARQQRLMTLHDRQRRNGLFRTNAPSLAISHAVRVLSSSLTMNARAMSVERRSRGPAPA